MPLLSLVSLDRSSAGLGHASGIHRALLLSLNSVVCVFPKTARTLPKRVDEEGSATGRLRNNLAATPSQIEERIYAQRGEIQASVSNG